MYIPHFPFKQPVLSYDPYVLQPQISQEVFDAHYQEFCIQDLLSLNSIVAATPSLQGWTLEEIILYQIRYEPVPIQKSAKFYAGSVYNHAIYFNGLAAANTTTPKGALLDAIMKHYGTISQFRSLILDAAYTALGPGWIWLNSEGDGNIHISVTSNNETPQLSALTPILTLDCWEHAYIGQYGIHNAQYANSWFDLINWNVAGQRFDESLQN